MIARVVAALTASLFTLPVLASLQPGVPVVLRLLVASLLAATAVRPAWGLMIVAALVPVATPIYVLAGAAFGGPETVQLLVAPLVLAVAVRVAVRGLPVRLRLFPPALVLASTLIAIAAVQLAVLQQATAFGDDFLRELWRTASTTYYTVEGGLWPLRDALIWGSAIALAVVAEYVLRVWPATRGAVLRMTVAGILGAAAMVVYRLIEVSVRAPAPFQMAWETLRSVRFNPHFGDLNAAGSLYALLFVPLVWWALAGRSPVRWGAAGLVGLALWTTGSRAAMGAAVLGLGLAWICARRPPMRHVVLIGLGLLPLAWIATEYSRGTQATRETAIAVRAELFRAGTTLAGEAPVFGLGFRGFLPASAAVISPELLARYPTLAKGENAHNNFLQVLVEFGAIGLVAFLWWIAAAAGPFVRDVRAARASPTAIGLFSGLTAFLVTCLAGHPLLSPQVLVPFGLVLGLAAGVVVGQDQPIGGRARLAAALLAVLVLASTAPRADEARARAVLGGVVLGAEPVAEAGPVPAWRIDDRGRWFLPGATRAATVEIARAGDEATRCGVSVAVDGRPVEADREIGAEPIRLAIDLSASAGDRASRRLDIRLAGAGCGAAVIRIDPRS